MQLNGGQFHLNAFESDERLQCRNGGVAASLDLAEPTNERCLGARKRPARFRLRPQTISIGARIRIPS